MKPVSCKPAAVSNPPVHVVVTRGDIVESEHLLDAVVLADGEVVESHGDPSVPRYLRSCLKPCQALPALRRGAVERWGLAPEHVAVMSSSHSGEPLHVALVRDILARTGIDEKLLWCGPHLPTHEPAAHALLASGAKAERIHNNCSGKHTCMLAACKLAGWPMETYHRPDHPLQHEIRGLLETLAGEAPASRGVDGCGVPTWAVSLLGAAWLFGAIARPEGKIDDPVLAAAAAKLADATADAPVAFAGTGRMSVRLLAVLGRRILLKGGAEGMWIMAARDRDWTAAIKSRDGGTRPHAPFILDLLRRHGLLDASAHPELDDLRRPLVRNHAGDVVGAVKLD